MRVTEPPMAAERYPPPGSTVHPYDWLRGPCSLTLTLVSLPLLCLLIQAKITSQLAWRFIMKEVIIFILTLLCKFTVVLSRPRFMSRPLVSRSQLLLLSLRNGQLGNHDAYRRIQLRTSAQCPGGLSSLLETLVTWPGRLGLASLLLGSGNSPEL